MPTSLKTIYGSEKRPKGKEQPLLSEDWQKFGDETSEYTSSSYDNAFVKGQELQRAVVGAHVVDVLKSMATMIAKGDTDFVLPQNDEHAPTYKKLTPHQKAFYLYRRFVSDHLPVVLDILVDDMTQEFSQKIQSET